MWSPVTGSETSLLLASAGPIWRNPVEAARLIRAARRRPSSLTRGRDATRRDTRTMDPEESTPEDLDAYFVSFREVKTGPCHRYYLIRGDSRGGQTLGAVGVPSSSGAASGAQPAYDYRNARNFTNHGTLATSSKRELMTWLDGVVAVGTARQGVVRGGGAPAETGRANDDDGGAVGGQPGGGSGANPSSPRGSEWINFSQDKFSFPDGRRGIRFYLVDAQGGATAAVLGEERDTRDGHYVYRKDDDFTAGPPLNCGNLTGVHRWLRDMCAGGAGVCWAPRVRTFPRGAAPKDAAPGGAAQPAAETETIASTRSTSSESAARRPNTTGARTPATRTRSPREGFGWRRGRCVG